MTIRRLGGALVCAWLGYFSFSPFGFLGLLRSVQQSLGPGWLFAMATVAWRVALSYNNAGVHLLYYLVATLVLTFVGPFVDSCNGFVAAWAALVCAVALLLDEMEAAAAAEEGGAAASDAAQ